jgi:thymidylate kinase
LIVEFIGVTGSGKTTLINQVRHKLSSSWEVTTSSDLVTGLVGLQGIKNVTAKNLLQETISFPYFLGSFPNHSQLISQTIRLFSRNTSLSVTTINNLRSIERKLGGLEIAQRQDQNKVILVDEGPFLTAHMFAFNDTPITKEEIKEYRRLLPLPDLIIYIKATTEVLLERSLNRSRPPREMKARNQSENEEYIKRAESLFDQMVDSSNIQSRMLIVDNSSPDLNAIDQTVEKISDFILIFAKKV